MYVVYYKNYESFDLVGVFDSSDGAAKAVDQHARNYIWNYYGYDGYENEPDYQDDLQSRKENYVVKLVALNSVARID